MHRGGTVPPQLDDHIAIQVRPSARDEAGIYNPEPGIPSFSGGIQLIVDGDREGYRRLGAYLLALAELDTADHPGYKDYHELTSRGGETHLQFLLYRR